MVRIATLLLGLLTTSSVFAAGGGEVHNVFGLNDIYFIIDIGVFGLLLLLFVRKPAQAFLAERHERIAKDFHEATRLKKAAHDELQDYRQRLDNVADEIVKIKEQFDKDGEAEIARIKREHLEAAALERDQTKRRIEQEQAAFEEKLRGQMVTKVVTLTESKLRERVNPDTQKELVSQFISNLKSINSLDDVA